MNASNHSLPKDLPWSQDPSQSVGNRASPLVIREHPVPSIAIGQSARCGVANPYESLPGVTETPVNGVCLGGESPPDTARHTPLWQPPVSLCSMPVLVVNRPL
jgi:hypothetical protein